MSEYFNSVNPENTPDNEAPQLDAEYWATKAEGMLPGEIVHSHSFTAFAMDAETKKLFVKASTEFGSDAYNPTPGHYGDRYGLMRVYQQDEAGNILDGFVADIRAVEKGGVRTDKINAQNDTQYGPLAELSAKYLPVLGYVFTDTEGGTSYKGLENLIGDAQFLAERVDQLRQPVQTGRDKEKEALGGLKELLNVEDDQEPISQSQTPIVDAYEAIKKIKDDAAQSAQPQQPEARPKGSRRWPWNR